MRRGASVAALATFMGLCLAVPTTISASAAGLPATDRSRTVRVSVASNGRQASGYSNFAAMSANGRYVAFATASALAKNDTNNHVDIYVRDRWAGWTRLVSVSSNGALSDGDSSQASISADGRYVAFASGADNLVPGGTHSSSNVFLHDMATGETRLVSVSSAGAPGDGASVSPAISADGRHVAFESTADNLVRRDTHRLVQVFSHDTVTGRTLLVSASDRGAPANSDVGMGPMVWISADGRYVTFDSPANNLVSGDTNQRIDVFVRDTVTAHTRRVSVSTKGAQGNNNSYGGAISASGRYVAFHSYATNFASRDTNDSSDAFVRDLRTGRTRLVSVSTSGKHGDWHSFAIAISADGRFVLFGSEADNLVPRDTNWRSDVFVRDLTAGTTRRVSVSSSGEQGNGDSWPCGISADGRTVLFESDADNLVAGDTNDQTDVFIHVSN